MASKSGYKKCFFSIFVLKVVYFLFQQNHNCILSNSFIYLKKNDVLERSMSQETVDGLRNPAVEDEDDGRTLSIMEQLGSGCFHLTDPMSPDSEYDEQLGFDDGVTMITISGDKPVLVARKAVTEETTLDEDDENESIRSTNTASLPYSNVHQAPIKFASIQRKIFIPNVPVHVEIIDYERSLTSHLLNPNLYTVQLTHGAFIWTVKKRYKDFYALHNQLSVFRASLNFPFPTKTHKEIRSSFRKIHDANGINGETTVDGAGSSRSIHRSRTPLPKQKKKKGSLPRFPKRPDAIIPFEAIPTRIKQLEKYLYNLLSISLYRNHHDTVSHTFRTKVNMRIVF